MKEDFDELADLEFPDDLFEEQSDGFESDFDVQYAKLRTAILQKNDMVALLCLKSATSGAAICRVDPREEHPSVQVYDDPEAAFEWFTKSLRSSKRNGWEVIYDGLPLEG